MQTAPYAKSRSFWQTLLRGTVSCIKATATSAAEEPSVVHIAYISSELVVQGLTCSVSKGLLGAPKTTVDTYFPAYEFLINFDLKKKNASLYVLPLP